MDRPALTFCHQLSSEECRKFFDNSSLPADLASQMSGKGIGIARWFGLRPKNTNLGIFWRALELKILDISCPFGIFYGHLVYFMVI
jgi:hypothetical protein